MRTVTKKIAVTCLQREDSVRSRIVQGDDAPIISMYGGCIVVIILGQLAEVLL